MSGLWKALLAMLGAGLFAWYLSRLGFASVWSTIARIGPFAPLLFLPYFLVYLVDCYAWTRVLPPRCLPFLSLLKIRWAGESVNNLIPSAYVGGEAAKIHLLRQRGVSGAEGAKSAVLSKTAQTVSQFVFVLLASILFLSLTTNSGVRTGLFLVVGGGIVAMGILFWVQRFGLFRVAIFILEFLPFKVRAWEARKPRLLELDRTISRFYREEPRRFLTSSFFYFCGWMLDLVEIYLVAFLLGMPISLSQALVVEAFAGVAKILGMWIPGSLGVQETGIVFVGRLAGLPENLSAAYALIRRARELVFAGIGIMFFYGSHLSRKDLSGSRVR